MKRTLIQLDDAMHRALRRKAYAEHRSMSSIVRDALTRELRSAPAAGKRGSALLAIVGIARDRHEPDKPLSVYHDDYWADALDQELKENAQRPAARRPRRRQAKR